MKNIFNLDGGIMGFLTKITDLVILNLVFLVTCIPIITIGPALTALYSITLKMVKNEEAYIVKNYFLAFKANFKISFLSWLIVLAVSILIFVDYRIIAQFTNLPSIFLILLLAVFFLFSLVILFLFPYIARFENTLRQSFKNAAFMAIASLPYTILLLLINGIFGVFLLFTPPQYSLLICILFAFSMLAFVQSLLFRKVFAKFEPKEDDSFGS